MIESQNTNSSNQFDTSSKDQQPSPAQPSNSLPPEETELTFTTDDMVKLQCGRRSPNVVTFTRSDENDTDS